ncbi:DMT family transporter [Afifella sp. JA880]|uniref:DMT family transporter n=1 Tax=Afifella sp. JA880 TaxID=2975280 RepID=UPI0021BAA4A1|nr:DMT family transporter [Afifella sp. JA880]MCT8266599.1 DMT family transporter [Afifella sp. JA880]
MPPVPALPRENQRGILLMLAAMVTFIVNDTLVKVASADLPTGEIIFLRGLIVSPIVIVLAVRRGAFANRSLLFHKTLIWRTLGEVAAAGLYLSALFRLPLANASAILQVVPLATTAGAALFLGETVGRRRWTAIAVGFSGALLVIQPGLDGFNIWSLVALLSVFAVVLRDLASKQLPKGLPTLAVTTAAAISVGLFGGFLMLFEEPVMPDAAVLATIFASGLCTVAGYTLIIAAMRTGDISVVAPFRYSFMIWAVLAQVLVFGAWPGPLLFIGTGILIATGIYTFYRERQVGASEARKALTAPPAR